jgi:hypothetical protein
MTIGLEYTLIIECNEKSHNILVFTKFAGEPPLVYQKQIWSLKNVTRRRLVVFIIPTYRFCD